MELQGKTYQDSKQEMMCVKGSSNIQRMQLACSGLISGSPTKRPRELLIDVMTHSLPSCFSLKKDLYSIRSNRKKSVAFKYAQLFMRILVATRTAFRSS